MRNILVICRQNVGRSQIAEGYLKARFAQMPDIKIASAGFEDIERMQRKYNNRPHPQAISCMQEIGIDISEQSITRLNAGHLAQADRIIVLLDKTELPPYARPFEHKMAFQPLNDLAPEARSSIPDLSLDGLYMTRESIGQLINNLAL